MVLRSRLLRLHHCPLRIGGYPFSYQNVVNWSSSTHLMPPHTPITAGKLRTRIYLPEGKSVCTRQWMKTCLCGESKRSFSLRASDNVNACVAVTSRNSVPKFNLGRVWRSLSDGDAMNGSIDAMGRECRGTLWTKIVAESFPYRFSILRVFCCRDYSTVKITAFRALQPL